MGAPEPKYYSHYEQKTDKVLRRSLKCLEGQPAGVADQRIKAIKQVLAKRGGEITMPSNTGVVVVGEIERSFDERLAIKFLNKAKNARERGLEFSLTLADMRKLLKRKTCHYTGMPLLDNCEQDHPQKRTLERLDSSVGYTAGNTVACSHAANTLKNKLFEEPNGSLNMTKKQFQNFASKICLGG